jgi:D-alanyl-D-alanine carboxypeptidase
VSSVDDLALWDAALSTERLLKRETLQRAWTSGTLTDGTETGYGYGWLLADYAGHRTIEHPGGIHGFLSYAVRIPDARVYVAILTNRMAPEPSLTLVTLRVAGLASDWAYQEPSLIVLDDAAVDTLTGIYHLTSRDCTLTREQSRLVLRTGGWCTALLPISPTEFLFESEPFIRVRFILGPNGTATALEVQHGRYALRIERGLKAEPG